MQPPNPFQFHLLNQSGNLMEQIHFIPGFEQVHVGQQLQPAEFRLFRSYVTKTLRIHGERHYARVQLSRLFHRTRVENWVHSFAPLAPNLVQALLPFIKIACYCFSWPYAELWRLSDTPGARTIHMVKSFAFPYDRWITVEPVLDNLDKHMNTRTITLPSREIPADTFTSQKLLWNIECIDHCSDMKRSRLMQKAFIERAFVLPLKGDGPSMVSHAIAFYGKIPNGLSNSGSRRFVESTAQYIKDCYNRTEDIGEDDADEVIGQAQQCQQFEEKGIMEACMEPRTGSSQLCRRLRRSQSYVHNLRSLDREM